MGQVSLEPKNSRENDVRGRVMLEDLGDVCVLHMSSRPGRGGRRIWCPSLPLATAGDCI